MQMFMVLGVALLSLWTTNGQVINPGRCPLPPVQQSFDISQYMGRWHGIQKVPAFFQKGKCSQATYSLQSDGTVEVINQSLQSDGRVTSTEGIARVVDPSDPAKLEVNFFTGSRPGPYWVLSTDYDSYSLVYSCTNVEDLQHRVFVWIMSRERTLSADTVEELLSILRSHGIYDKLQVGDQSDCGSMPQ
ncbi:apolipoprotein D-like [Osmerus mordax]|uniref:apolipoprotein D-like n=1 Tax=Osmerus mordax TaxID=8014 RepID=UPI0035104CE6